jgi:quinol---cytochrome c reductase cytochrome c subunit, bacillus type
VATTQEWRRNFTQYKQDVKKRGKPFYPYAMFHDTVMSLVVVSVIIALASVWYFTSTKDPNDCSKSWTSCTLGPRYSEPADPATTNFVPRPDWYFYFLFYLLRIFKWPDSVILGTVGIPTILLIIAFAIPFVDRRMERRLTRRPVAVVAAILVVVSMGVLTYKGATAKEALASEVVQAVPQWAKREGFANNPNAVAGAKIFASSGCTACHTYLGTGSSNLGAPDLSAIGKNGKPPSFFSQYVSDPSKYGNNVMPKFASLGQQKLKQLGEFLGASKGPK